MSRSIGRVVLFFPYHPDKINLTYENPVTRVSAPPLDNKVALLLSKDRSIDPRPPK